MKGRIVWSPDTRKYHLLRKHWLYGYDKVSKGFETKEEVVSFDGDYKWESANLRLAYVEEMI